MVDSEPSQVNNSSFDRSALQMKPPPDKPRLLLVEDDDALADLIHRYLSNHFFEVSRVASGDEGAKAIVDTQPDLVILDLMLPGMNGLEVCRQVREDFSGGLLMLTASQSEADHVAGLELGADDFVTKPIEPRVLLARIRTQLRRLRSIHAPSDDRQDGVLSIETLEVNLRSRSVYVAGKPVPTTTMEFDILALLAKENGSVVTRDELYESVMGTVYDGIDRGMDVHISRIRRKLQAAGFDTRQLKSVRAVGYLLASQ